MTNPYRNKEYLVPNVLSTVAAVVLLGTLGSMVFMKKPTLKGLQSKYNRQKLQEQIATKKAKDRAAEILAYRDSLSWGENPQMAGTAAMANVTEMARKHGVKLVSFRPQKTNDLGNLSILPFLINVDGPFPNVVSFAHDLEATQTKLAPNLLQVTSADPASDRVTANIGVIAFLNTPSSASGTTNDAKEAPHGKGS